MLFFSFNKDENWFATLTKVAILKTKLLVGNDHVIDIFTSEDMENISLCVSHSVSYCQLYNKVKLYLFVIFYAIFVLYFCVLQKAPHKNLQLFLLQVC